MKTKNKNYGVKVITLGCSKNIVDSENIVTQLRGNEIDAFHEADRDDSEVIIVNTCGFIDLAKQESINTILEYAERKKAGEIEKLYVTGCLSHRYKLDLEAEIPEVDAFFGTMELPALLAKFDADYKHELIGERRISTLPHYAYLKISEGCNRTCSFCAIPLMRGKHISKPKEALIHEARALAKQGVKEIMLIAQELTYYGLDLYKKRELPDLLRQLADVDGIEWIRLHYAYPSKFPLEIFDAMAEIPKVCNYLDMPLQHASDSVLDRMKRQITSREMAELLDYSRKRVDHIALRTTMMVGFPGETEQEYEELCDFVRNQRFDRLGVFKYSHEEDTSAYLLPDDIDAELKEERAADLIEIQREISLEKNQEKIGNTYKTLIDRKEGAYFIGRTEHDSPEVDNEVLIDAKKYFLRIGDFASVKITKADDFDLHGIPMINE